MTFVNINMRVCPYLFRESAHCIFCVDNEIEQQTQENDIYYSSFCDKAWSTVLVLVDLKYGFSKVFNKHHRLNK